MGVTAGDFDNDGRPDLYLTDDGPNQLWHNQGDGTFRDVTAKAGVDDPRWSVAAVAFDFDRDGWLDLFVVNYVEFDARPQPALLRPQQPPRLLRPRRFPGGRRPPLPQPRRRHLRGRLGARRHRRPARPRPRRRRRRLRRRRLARPLRRQRRGRELPLAQQPRRHLPTRARCSPARRSTRDGMAEADMGVDAGDFDDDGDFDIVLAHIAGETNTLYVNDGGAIFSRPHRGERHRRTPASPSPPSAPAGSTTTATAWLDLLTVNGAVRIVEAQARPATPSRSQTNQLFHNLGPARRPGALRRRQRPRRPAFALPEVSRGAAFGDVDNDGDTDVLVTNDDGPARLLVNQVGNDRPWLGLRLLDRTAADALGAAGRGAPRRRSDPAAAGAHRRLLRLGQRSAGAGGAGGRGEGDRRKGPLARRRPRALPAAAGWRLRHASEGAGSAKEPRRERPRRRGPTAAAARCSRRGRRSAAGGGAGGAGQADAVAMPFPSTAGGRAGRRPSIVEVQHFLFATLSDAKTPTADRADTYGELGQLYQAYSFDAAATASYRDAEAMAPDDPRWPYYLGGLARRRGGWTRPPTLTAVRWRWVPTASPPSSTSARSRSPAATPPRPRTPSGARSPPSRTAPRRRRGSARSPSPPAAASEAVDGLTRALTRRRRPTSSTSRWRRLPRPAARRGQGARQLARRGTSACADPLLAG